MNKLLVSSSKSFGIIQRVHPFLSSQRLSYLSTDSIQNVKPLLLFQNVCEARRLCNEDGFRTAGKDWNFQIAVSPSNPSSHPPILKTVSLQRVSKKGLDFIIKKGVGASLLSQNRPTSVLYKMGTFAPGEEVEQWRADGHCEILDLHEIFHVVSHFSIVGMVASKRAAREAASNFVDDNTSCPVISKDQQLLQNHSHFVELVQTTRIELENGNISNEEIEDSVQAYRFHPFRIERLKGGPDTLLWDRCEWHINDNVEWDGPLNLLPH